MSDRHANITDDRWLHKPKGFAGAVNDTVLTKENGAMSYQGYAGLAGNLDHANLQNSGTNTHAQIDAHIASTSNPHSVGIADVSPLTTDGDLMMYSTTNTRLGIGTTGQVLSVSSGGIPEWVTNPSGFADPMTTRGDLIFKDATNTTTRLGIGAANTVLYSDGTNVVKLHEQRNWRAVSAAETVQAGAKLLVNTNGGAVTVTLPASPATGDEVHFVDQGYDFNTNALTVGRNSSNIANSASDLVVNTQGAAFGLVYSGDATTGWTYTEK